MCWRAKGPTTRRTETSPPPARSICSIRTKSTKAFTRSLAEASAMARALAVVPYQDFAGGSAYGAVEAQYYNGPWERGDNLHRINSVLRWARGTQLDGAAVTFMGYANKWYSTDQIPERAVYSGLKSLWGTLDPTDGGDTTRFSLSGRWSQTEGNHCLSRRTLCHAFDARSLQQLHLLPRQSKPRRSVPPIRSAHHGRRQCRACDQVGQFWSSSPDPHRPAESLRRHSSRPAGQFSSHAL